MYAGKYSTNRIFLDHRNIKKHKNLIHFSILSFVTVGSVEDADAVINYFNNTIGQRITVSYSEKSAKDFNKPCESNKANDDFYLSLFKDPRFSISFTSELYTTICIYNSRITSFTFFI